VRSQFWSTFSSSGSVLDGQPPSSLDDSYDSRRLVRALPLPAEAIVELQVRYEVIEELGRGAMGVVYRARDKELNRDVAVKVLRDAGASTKQLARFKREGEIAASIDHPGIVRVFGAGRVAGCPYLAYELIEGGRSLADEIEVSDLRRRVELVCQLAHGLGAAHAQGVVHRDVKPANVLVDPRGKVRLTDFGLASARSGERLTKTGAMLGTPLFMAPELVRGQRQSVGPWTDVWAAGVLLYACIANELPFEGGDMFSLGGQICAADYEPLRKLVPGVDPALEAIVDRALEVDPQQRFADGAQLAEALETYLRGEGEAAPRGLHVGWRGLIAVALLAGFVGGLAAVFAVFASGDPSQGAPPTLELMSPPPPWTIHDLIYLDVLAEGQAPLRLTGVGGFTRPEPGKPLRIKAPLKVGANTLQLTLTDEAGQQAELTVSVERLEVPGWLVEVPPERQPPLPLPSGVQAEVSPGDYLNVKDGSLLRWVPPGSFDMGSDDEDVSTKFPPSPVHRVTITRGYFMGKLEVTQGQFMRFCEETGATPPPVVVRNPRLPVTVVDHNDARAYCRWAGGRLPTEAEWEYAARGTDGRIHTWGNTEELWRANLNHPDDSYDGIAPAGSFPSSASPFGCEDMLGNVWEWCFDRYGPYSAEPQTDPFGPREGLMNPAEPELGEWRVSRGGSWTSTGAHYVYSRSLSGVFHKTSSQGFRLCVPVTPATPTPPEAR